MAHKRFYSAYQEARDLPDDLAHVLNVEAKLQHLPMDRRVLCRPGLPQDMRPFQVPPGQWQVHLLKSHAVLLQLDPVMSFYVGRHFYIYFHPLTFFKVTAITNAKIGRASCMERECQYE